MNENGNILANTLVHHMKNQTQKSVNVQAVAMNHESFVLIFNLKASN